MAAEGWPGLLWSQLIPNWRQKISLPVCCVSGPCPRSYRTTATGEEIIAAVEAALAGTCRFYLVMRWKMF